MLCLLPESLEFKGLYQYATGLEGTGFRVNLPHREAFSPDAAYHVGPRSGMRFPEGAPIFVVEVRSEDRYGTALEQAMQEKRADYFACGTLVVWDVELLREDVINVYRASDPDNSTVYRRGETAEAEPAVPGWRMHWKTCWRVPFHTNVGDPIGRGLHPALGHEDLSHGRGRRASLAHRRALSHGNQPPIQNDPS